MVCGRIREVQAGMQKQRHAMPCKRNSVLLQRNGSKGRQGTCGERKEPVLLPVVKMRDVG